jgi:hypothetical protein
MTTSASAKTNLILDLGIFSAFLVVSNPHLTGNNIHEWLGISFTAAIITHLLFHWQWILKIGGEFFKKLFHQSRLNFVINSLFFIAMTGAIFSGILISKDVLQLFGIQLNAGQGWKSIHHLTSDASLLTLGVHIAMHWKWILSNLGRYVVSPIRALFRKNPQPGSSLASQTVRINDQK